MKWLYAGMAAALVTAAASVGAAEHQPNERFMNACMKQAGKLAGAQELCSCVQANLRKKLDAKDFELVTRTYEGDAAAEKELDKREALASFDMEVAEECRENPRFRVK